jgi:ubiquinone/menaquinone biosynthesis C-methylase UbiE
MALVKDLADNTANFIWNVDHSFPGMHTALSLNEKRNRRMEQKHYIIRGGEEGRARLRVLSRVMRPTTLSLLDRAGIRPGMECLEVGCGSGDLAFDLSQMVGAGGRVVATDIDEIKLRLARQEAEQQRLTNLEFRLADIVEDEFEKFDFAHARFVLTHLRNPQEALEKMWRAIRPGGILVLQDSDFRGCFCHPECAAFSRYVQLYTQTAQRRAVDPNIGPRLPGLLAKAGFEKIQINVVQNAAMSGEVKLMAPLTMENIADAVLAAGLASRAELDRLVHELYEFARDPDTVIGGPRVVEAWGHRPLRAT